MRAWPTTDPPRPPTAPAARRSRCRRRRCRVTSRVGGWRRRRMGAGCPMSISRRRRIGCAGFWIFVIVLLAINWLSVLLFQPGSSRGSTVPFSPYFLQQVEAGKVKSITTTGDTIEGTFTVEADATRPTTRRRRATTLFSTQVPTFWNHDALTTLLQANGRAGQREVHRPSAPRCWPRSCSGSGRRCCWSGCSCCSPGARRPARAAAWAGWGTSGARRRGGSIRRRSGSRSTMSPGSTRPRPS